jgi:hypothetical protein
MYIKDKEYYHLHNKKIYNELWVVGNLLNFSNKNMNYFNEYYEKHSPKILVNGVMHLPMDALKIILENNLHIKDMRYSDYLFKSLKSIITDLSLYIREEIFEEVRVKYFPGLPS